VGNDRRGRVDRGRGGGFNGSAISTVERSSAREGGVERCVQNRHQVTSASRWNKVTRSMQYIIGISASQFLSLTYTELREID